MKNNRINKRVYPRYLLDLDTDVSVGGQEFKGKIKDLSVEGIGILLPGVDTIPSSEVEIKVDDIECESQGAIVWKKITDSGLLFGVRKTGPIAGKVPNYRIADLLIGIKKKAMTGILQVNVNSTTKKVFFSQGEVIFSSSNLESDRLGEMLVELKKINREQYHEAVEVMEKTGKRLAAVLVELGYLKPVELAWSVRYQVEKMILDLFELDDGSFIFREEPLPVDEVITLKLSTGNLIYRGIKKIDDMERIRKGCPPMDSVLFFSSEPLNLFQDISLSQNDKKMLTLFDGRKTIEEILSLSHLNEDETLKAIYALYHAQLLEIIERGEVDESIDKDDILEKAEPEVDQALVDKIEKLYIKHKDLSYHDILDISRSASSTEIKRAYYKMAREFHPDRYLHLQSDSLKAKLNTIFAYVNEAYRSLSQNGIDQSTASTADDSIKKGADNKEIARKKFQEGRSYLGTGNFEQALLFLGQALYFDRSVANYHFYYGIALFKSDKIKDAEASIRKAIQLDPDNADYVAELGNLYLKLGFRTRARNTFEQALKLVPSHIKAAEGLQNTLNT
jgi:tetratricopeptide (TPR) repeat protein